MSVTLRKRKNADGTILKAARLYFDILGNFGGKQSGLNTTINTQNNYIQINQTKLNQEIVQQLTQQQLNQIEAVLNCVSNSTV